MALLIIPFALLLLCIAVLPLTAGHWWEKNRNKGIVSGILAAPVFAYFLIHDRHLLEHTAVDYAAFIALLGALFTISGGIYIRGAFAGLPHINAAFLLIGALMSNLIGTTGASMLLIRPLLRANERRRHKAHIVIFFIFIVSNISGLLTPLGDPPLFLGYLNGIDFTWTFRLFPQWAVMVAGLLAVFFFFDAYYFKAEHQDVRKILKANDGYLSERFGIEGKRNFIFLAAVIAILFLVSSKTGQALLLAAAAGISFRMTPRGVHEKNRFGFDPILEVAILFAGIFVTMIPALVLLEAEGGRFGLEHAWQYFWLTGILSGFLDNAPTYLTFTSLAKGALGLGGEGLRELMHHPQGAAFLAAISCGSVFMGANTYIGNGPNFMVKAIAGHSKVKMPGFFGYMLWSAGILLPLFVLVSFLFFRG